MDLRSFTVAEALSRGATRSELRRRAYRIPFHGVRTLAEPPAAHASLRDRVACAAEEFAPLLRADGDPVHAFSHVTALLLDCPIRCDPSLHLTTKRPRAPFRRKGLYGHSTDCFQVWNGSETVPIVEPVLAFLQSATLLSFHELVVAADHLVKSSWIGSTRRSLVTLESLRRSSAEYSGRGVRRARAALEFTRQGAESRMETLLRLLMAQFGLDVLELQVDIYHDGAWIGRLDMVDRDRKLIIEYDGEQHRTDRGQYLKDQRRLDRARAAGYSILRLHKEDVLVRPLQTVHVIADFLGLPLRPVDTQFARYFTER